MCQSHLPGVAHGAGAGAGQLRAASRGCRPVSFLLVLPGLRQPLCGEEVPGPSPTTRDRTQKDPVGGCQWPRPPQGARGQVFGHRRQADREEGGRPEYTPGSGHTILRHFRNVLCTLTQAGEPETSVHNFFKKFRKQHPPLPSLPPPQAVTDSVRASAPQRGRRARHPRESCRGRAESYSLPE